MTATTSRTRFICFILPLRSGRRLSDVADVVLNELPVIAALHPHVGAAVGWLPVDRPAVRHDGELATVEEANHVLVGHLRVLAVLERRHVLRLVLDLTKRRNVRVVVGHDAVDSLAVSSLSRNSAAVHCLSKAIN